MPSPRSSSRPRSCWHDDPGAANRALTPRVGCTGPPLRRATPRMGDRPRARARGRHRPRVRMHPPAGLPRARPAPRGGLRRGERDVRRAPKARHGRRSPPRDPVGRRFGSGASRRSSTSATCGPSSCSSCCSTSAPAPMRHRSCASRMRSLIRGELALELQLREAADFDRTLVLWRLSVVRAALSFVEALLDQRTVDPVVYRPIGVVASPHVDLDGMPLQPIADAQGPSRIEVFEPHRGCLDDLGGFSHLWVLAHLHETTGWDPRSRRSSTTARTGRSRRARRGVRIRSACRWRGSSRSTTSRSSSPASTCSRALPFSISSPTSRCSTFPTRRTSGRAGSRAAPSGSSNGGRTTASSRAADARRARGPPP